MFSLVLVCSIYVVFGVDKSMHEYVFNVCMSLGTAIGRLPHS